MEDPDTKELLSTEANRLTENGFVGDPYDKFFKSVRYYYRKKLNRQHKDDGETKQRKEYQGINHDILVIMDEHIKDQIINSITLNKRSTEPSDETQIIKDANIFISKVSPSMAFDDYISKHKTEILEEVKRIQDPTNHSTQREEIETMLAKFKKTYKNRFYKIRVALSSSQ
jgi:hypothetical protein